jgi:acyl dehydratase
MNYGHDSVRYLGPVYPGDTLTATAEVTETREKGEDWGVVITDVEVTNGDGETVLVETHRFLVATTDHPALSE